MKKIKAPCLQKYRFSLGSCSHLDLFEPSVDILPLGLGKVIPVPLLPRGREHALYLTHLQTGRSSRLPVTRSRTLIQAWGHCYQRHKGTFEVKIFILLILTSKCILLCLCLVLTIDAKSGSSVCQASAVYAHRQSSCSTQEQTNQQPVLCLPVSYASTVSESVLKFFHLFKIFYYTARAKLSTPNRHQLTAHSLCQTWWLKLMQTDTKF